ncbi:MAG: hypothetical protein LBH24_02710 [Clostridiales bacterium]|jgi:hypothetical protein|nr:hypothetical protein [Clostridiales bacterium]
MGTNWSINETKQLFNLVYEASESGKGLNRAFIKMAQLCGKSVNSIRNYYYSQLKLFELMPSFAKELGIKVVGAKRESFAVFERAEIDELVRSVLIGKAKGRSVRAVIADLSKGDKKLALRLQNKYRSMVSHHRDRLDKLMTTLGEAGQPYYDPYLKRVMTGREEDDNVKKLAEYIASLDNDQMADVVKRLLLKS